MDLKSVLVGVAIGYALHYAVVRGGQPTVTAATAP